MAFLESLTTLARHPEPKFSDPMTNDEHRQNVGPLHLSRQAHHQPASPALAHFSTGCANCQGDLVAMLAKEGSAQGMAARSAVEQANRPRSTAAAATAAAALEDCVLYLGR